MSSRRAAAGAVAAQFSQALASFLLTVAAVRTLRPADFGLLALLLGTLVLATALMTGFVGDSLTVLDRGSPRIRAGLQAWCAVIAGGLAVTGWLVTWLVGLLPVGHAVVFGLALAAFVVEEIARRLLMATLRFWSIVTVDLSYLVTAAVVLTGLRLHADRFALLDYLLALLAGQVLATAVALTLLPGTERRWAPRRPAAIREVAVFGSWRAGQQAIRPAALTLMRTLVLAAAGRASLGRLESARVYMSPGLLLVAGTGGFLLATAARRQGSIATALHRADRSTAALVAAAAAFGLAALLALPLLGPLITGGGTPMSATAVAGWALLNVSAAATMPYVSLAAVRGRQATVVLLRVVDTALSIALVGLVLLVATRSYVLTPYAMSVGGFVGAALQRRVLATAARPARPAAERPLPAEDLLPAERTLPVTGVPPRE